MIFRKESNNVDRRLKPEFLTQWAIEIVSTRVFVSLTYNCDVGRYINAVFYITANGRVVTQ